MKTVLEMSVKITDLSGCHVYGHQTGWVGSGMSHWYTRSQPAWMLETCFATLVFTCHSTIHNSRHHVQLIVWYNNCVILPCATTWVGLIIWVFWQYKHSIWVILKLCVKNAQNACNHLLFGSFVPCWNGNFMQARVCTQKMNNALCGYFWVVQMHAFRQNYIKILSQTWAQ